MNKPIVVITGASSGIGKEAAINLSKDHTVVVIGRSKATEEIAHSIGADYFLVDYSSLESVRELAKKLLAKYPRIDFLINNAGGVMKHIENTDDGFESTYQVNYLSPFLLTELLLDRLIESRAGIINTSSSANRMAIINMNDITKSKLPIIAYGNSKLLDLIHAIELSKRYGSKGIEAVSFHPGVVATNFAVGSGGVFELMIQKVFKRVLKTPAQGADTLVWLVRNKAEWTPGAYYANRKTTSYHHLAKNATLTAAIWDMTQKDLITAQNK